MVEDAEEDADEDADDDEDDDEDADADDDHKLNATHLSDSLPDVWVNHYFFEDL